jgi:aspartoacylase
MNQIKRVAIVGGTHGNEFTGAYLVKKLALTLLGNPKAFEQCKRYIDKDLNRCFLWQDLQNPTLSTYEEIQAKLIHQMLGPKGQSQVDFLIDMHSTTANMGLTLILSNLHPFNLRLAAYVNLLNPLVKIFSWAPPDQETAFLRTICELGYSIEVGAVPQGVLDARLFQQTEELIYTILDYLEAYNEGKTPEENSAVTVYQCVEILDYPRNESGEIQGMIHPQLQFRDYEPLHPGDPIFITFAGEEITYKGDKTVYPVFINEAAYYEKAIAMCLTEKQELIFS